jgi:hypothetical protein
VGDAISRVTLERALQLAIVALILTAVLASGSILAWVGPARKLRWAALAAVLALALALAARRGVLPRPSAVLAAACAFLALGLVSVAWTAFPRIAAGRWAALAALFAAGAALAVAGIGRPATLRGLLDAVLAGCAAVAIGGLLVLAFDHDRAVDPATTSLPARYQGLGGGPNTATMVLAVGVPLAALTFLDTRRPLTRYLAVAVLLLLLGSIVASGSRGALAGAFSGLLVFAVLVPRRPGLRLAAAAGVVVLAAVAVALTRLPSPAEAAPRAPAPSHAAQADAGGTFRPKQGYLDANALLRLQDDVGHPPIGIGSTNRQPRTLTGSSGRTEAWRGALRLGAERPVLGYGIGTEDHVFVDRYVGFNSNVPENSYIGLFLQLGGLGLAVFLGLVVALLVRAATAARRLHGQELRIAAGAAGGLVAGLVLGCFQSFLVAVGNNATAAVWICASVLAAVTTARASLARA